ncbi:MAG: hypothetical protein O2962_02260 [Cyanobacteria bacterium]|nr:hypothetical protein [Cyanobacteriota bacterium]
MNKAISKSPASPAKTPKPVRAKNKKEPSIRPLLDRDGLTVKQLNEAEFADEPKKFSFDFKTTQVFIPRDQRRNQASSLEIDRFVAQAMPSGEIMLETYSSSKGTMYYVIVEFDDHYYLLKRPKKETEFKLQGLIPEYKVDELRERLAE